jgi:eukaryotic-like serine/threonine-protein kinase
MIEFMKCVVEGIAANGVKGLLELVPGGKYVYDVGAYAIKRHREKKAQKKLEDEVKEMIGARADDAFAQAKQAVEEAAPNLSPREKELVTQYVAAIPEAARQSLKRKEDPTGSSLPFGYTIHEPDDVVKLLPPHAPQFVPGEFLPGREENWRLERRLGGGGFGEVWLARHCFKRSEKPRAVKFCTDASARQKLVTHEKQLIVRVMEHAGDHPNIVPLLECHLTGETPWLMYEFVDGGTLADAILEWQKLAPSERLKRAVAALHTLAGAVGHCHALAPAIIHRDLKPANVLRDTTGALRVTDFGIGGTAVDFLVAEETRGARSVVGRLPTMLSGSYSLLYASPQQRKGEKPDPRDDVHALGVIAYQMLTGDLSAAPGRDMDDDLRDAGASDELIALIGKSVAQKAERRPKDAREWEKGLAALLPKAPATVSAPKPAPPPSTRVPTPQPGASGDDLWYLMSQDGNDETRLIADSTSNIISALLDGARHFGDLDTILVSRTKTGNFVPLQNTDAFRYLVQVLHSRDSKSRKSPDPQAPIRITCPHCSAALSMRAEHAARKVKCPRCGGVIPPRQ